MTQTRDKRRFAHFEYDPVEDRLGEGPLSTVVAGIIGVLIVTALTLGAGTLLRRRRGQ